MNLVTRMRMIAAGALLAVSLGASGQLYFTDLFNPDFSTGHINRVNISGSGLKMILDTGGGIRGFDIDRQGGKMYWTDVDNAVIRRANLDGSGQQDLVHLSGSGEDAPFPSALAIYKQGGKMYWGDQTLGTISRANLDGSNPEVLLFTPFHRGLAIDAVNGKMYWSTSISQFRGEIWRANLDGSNAQAAISTIDQRFKPNKLALDVAGGKIYWTDYVLDVVKRANFDGSFMETLYVAPINRNTQGITIDLQARKIYWGQDIEIEGADGKIMVANLNGSNARDFIYGFGHVTEVKFVPTPYVVPLNP